MTQPRPSIRALNERALLGAIMSLISKGNPHPLRVDPVFMKLYRLWDATWYIPP